MEQIFSKLVDELQTSKLDILESITEILRALRNSTSSSNIQNHIVNNTEIVPILNKLFKKLLQIDKHHISLKILLQFLINLISMNEHAAKQIHIVFNENLFLCLTDNIHIYETSALLYNVSLFVPICSSQIIEHFLSLYNSDRFNEFISFFLENTFSSNHFWTIYEKIQLENRVVTLTIVKDILNERRPVNLPDNAIDILLRTFLGSSNIIFQIKVDDLNNLKVYEVALLLQILSSLSSMENYLFKFQANRDLLIHSGVVLINIHRLGRETDSYFAPVQKLSEFGTEKELRDHPAYGFKGDLIRLIGNLCWKNLEMQNLVSYL